MDIINSIFSILTGNILVFILILSVVVFIHEMGHYLVGRWCGIYATTFSIGFGKEIWGFNGKDGTRWRVAMIPLGGYVKFFGDENAASMPDDEQIDEMSDEDKARSFHHASVLRRSLTVLAGPMANFILTIVIFTAFFTIYGKQTTDPIISQVVASSPAEEAGLLPGDQFVMVDDVKINVFNDVKRYVSSRPETKVDITILRGGEQQVISLIPDRKVTEDRFCNKTEEGIMGVVVVPDETNSRRLEFGVTGAVGQAFSESWFIVTRTFDYIGNIFVGRESASQLSGPIGISKMSGQVASLGFIAVIQLIAIISLSIGLLNLMPIPILDGGHLVFYLIEAILGRPVPAKAQEFAFRIGIMLILSLMLFTTFNDVSSLFNSGCEIEPVQ